MIDKDTIIKLAREADLSDGMELEQEVAALERFAAAIYKLGLEDAAKVAESYIAPGIGKEIAAAIRALDHIPDARKKGEA